jgi:hypothetical protein
MRVERSGQLEPLDGTHHQIHRLLREPPGANKVGRRPRGADQIERGQASPLQLRFTGHRLTVGRPDAYVLQFSHGAARGRPGEASSGWLR